MDLRSKARVSVFFLDKDVINGLTNDEFNSLKGKLNIRQHEVNYPFTYQC